VNLFAQNSEILDQLSYSGEYGVGDMNWNLSPDDIRIWKIRIIYRRYKS